MLPSFVFPLAALLNSIELSSQSDGNPRGEPNYHHSPSTATDTPDQISLGDSSFRERSRSPRRPPLRVLGYTLKGLGHLRLIPRRNLERKFEFRRYIIPAGKPITLQVTHESYPIMFNREHVVLSASNGDIFALLEFNGLLRAIYRTDAHRTRVKMNMISGAINNMTPDEVRDCPVGRNNPISSNAFMRIVAREDSLQSDGIVLISNTDEGRNDGSSSSASLQSPDLTSPEDPPLHAMTDSPPGRPPSGQVLGYQVEKLGYLRLVPRSNQHQRFEFRRYVFPIEKKLSLLVRNGKFVRVPSREHIVLSTSNGDVYAVLEYTGLFRGIYKVGKYHPRIKINMISRAVENMTEDEMKMNRVGRSFPNSFIEVVVDEDSLQAVYR